MTSNPELFTWDVWPEDDIGWDHNTRAPGIFTFGNAIQVWAIMQNRPTSIADAARAFNCPPERIEDAVESHDWMFLEGPEDDYEKLMIQHEGE